MVAPIRTIKAPRAVPLDRDVFVRLCEKQGAYTEAERAELVESARSTVRKWLKGEIEPMLSKSRRVARRLESTVDELWPEDAA